jgi:hypothetical protein
VIVDAVVDLDPHVEVDGDVEVDPIVEVDVDPGARSMSTMESRSTSPSRSRVAVNDQVNDHVNRLFRDGN